MFCSTEVFGERGDAEMTDVDVLSDSSSSKTSTECCFTDFMLFTQDKFHWRFHLLPRRESLGLYGKLYPMAKSVQRRSNQG